MEKKPLRQFLPGSLILSVGSFGCNLSCPFCQNHEISMPDAAGAACRKITPKELAELAADCCGRGDRYGRENIGVAYTYNEPLVGYEFVRDTAELVRERGMKNVLVTNGTAEISVLEELLPYIDAMNIDLKGFSEAYYRKLGGDLETVKRFIRRAAASCHVELTTLIIPGENDTPEQMSEHPANEYVEAFINNADKSHVLCVHNIMITPKALIQTDDGPEHAIRVMNKMNCLPYMS